MESVTYISSMKRTTEVAAAIELYKQAGRNFVSVSMWVNAARDALPQLDVSSIDTTHLLDASNRQFNSRPSDAHLSRRKFLDDLQFFAMESLQMTYRNVIGLEQVLKLSTEICHASFEVEKLERMDAAIKQNLYVAREAERKSATLYSSVSLC